MNNRAALEDLKAFISIRTDEELVWVLHVFNKNVVADRFSELTRREREISVLKSDIDNLNSFKQLKEIKNFIIKFCEEYTISQIDGLIDDLLDFKSKMEVSGIDFLELKNNIRFLNFACHLMNKEVKERELKNFKSLYINFLYVSLTYSTYYKNPRHVERIISKFSEIHSKHPSHFKDDEDKNFYIWAKKYMDENPSYKSKYYNPIEESDYPLVVNSIFDLLYNENEEVHYALRRKLSNAWYQKQYRQKNKGKKENYYALTKKAKENLKVLCYKRNLTEEQVIESLINEHYAKECRDQQNGSHLY